MSVNGNTPLDPTGKAITYVNDVKPPMPVVPVIDSSIPPPDGWRKLLKE